MPLKKTRITFRLDPKEIKRLEKLARKQEITLSQLIRDKIKEL